MPADPPEARPLVPRNDTRPASPRDPLPGSRRDRLPHSTSAGPPPGSGAQEPPPLTEALSSQATSSDERLDAIGTLAAVIAHDFNNLLTVIRGFSEVHLASHDPDDPCREDLVEIGRAADRCAALVRQLLAVGRRQPVQPRRVRLDDVLARALPVVREQVGDRVDVVVRSDPEVPAVFVDEGQLVQAVLELAANARDAMPAGGTLTIETSASRLDESFAEMHPGVAPGLYAVLATSDTGRGMDDATLARAFEPFFTTKAAGQGKGLGLPSVQGVVRQAGGSIDVASSPGRGTTFRIFLPASVAAPVGASAPQETESAGAAERAGAAESAGAA